MCVFPSKMVGSWWAPCVFPGKLVGSWWVPCVFPSKMVGSWWAPGGFLVFFQVKWWAPGGLLVFFQVKWWAPGKLLAFFQVKWWHSGGLLVFSQVKWWARLLAQAVSAIACDIHEFSYCSLIWHDVSGLMSSFFGFDNPRFAWGLTFSHLPFPCDNTVLSNGRRSRSKRCGEGECPSSHRAYRAHRSRSQPNPACISSIIQRVFSATSSRQTDDNVRLRPRAAIQTAKDRSRWGLPSFSQHAASSRIGVGWHGPQCTTEAAAL